MEGVSPNKEMLIESDSDEIDVEANCSMENVDGENKATPRRKEPRPPAVGMEFQSYDDAYNFYNCYAKDLGFGVRIKNSYTGRNSNEKCGAVLCCSHEGFKPNKESNRVRPGRRVGCPAMIRLKLVEFQMWKVIEINLDHNHLTTPSSVRFYKSHKKIGVGIRRKLELHCDAGIRTNKSFHSIVVEAGGYENLTFDEKDARNLVGKYKRLKLKEGDAQALYNYFCCMQTKNSNFFYLMDLNDEGRLKNVFWADARSRAACAYFGDVISQSSLGSFQSLLGQLSQTESTFDGQVNIGTVLGSSTSLSTSFPGGTTLFYSNEIGQGSNGGNMFSRSENGA